MNETTPAEHLMNQELIRNPTEYPNLVQILMRQNQFKEKEAKELIKEDRVPEGKLTNKFLRRIFSTHMMHEMYKNSICCRMKRIRVNPDVNRVNCRDCLRIIEQRMNPEPQVATEGV